MYFAKQRFFWEESVAKYKKDFQEHKKKDFHEELFPNETNKGAKYKNISRNIGKKILSILKHKTSKYILKEVNFETKKKILWSTPQIDPKTG